MAFGSLVRTTRLLLAASAALPLLAFGQPAAVDPAATKILKTATDFLASQRQFSVETRNTLEVVLTSGQKIQFDNGARMTAQRPDRLRAERRGDLVDQVFYYDGKSLTLHNPAEKSYATVAAPGTLEAMLDFARTSLDIVAPAGDLLYSNAYDLLMTDVTQGFIVGKGIVEGVRCDHLAFRAPHVDLQVWVQDSQQPLIRKLVITTRDVANAPQFSVVITKWNLEPKVSEAMFRFSPPPGARKVDFLPAGTR